MSFLRFISKEMQRPTNYGWFHLLFLGLVIGFTVLICMLYKNCREKTFRRIILIGWILIFLFELYKQIVFSYSESNNLAVWDYQWYAFPYQMCSSTLYLLPIVIFVKDYKLRDAVISYLSIFVLFAGICVMIYPNDVFVNMIGINLQTMIHHGLQVIFGIFFIVYNRKKWNDLLNVGYAYNPGYISPEMDEKYATNAPKENAPVISLETAMYERDTLDTDKALELLKSLEN